MESIAKVSLAKVHIFRAVLLDLDLVERIETTKQQGATQEMLRELGLS